MVKVFLPLCHLKAGILHRILCIDHRQLAKEKQMKKIFKYTCILILSQILFLSLPQSIFNTYSITTSTSTDEGISYLSNDKPTAPDKIHHD